MIISSMNLWKEKDDNRFSYINAVLLINVKVLKSACYMLCQTDTASVLSEAIEYIKFLHEQVTVSPISH